MLQSDLSSLIQDRIARFCHSAQYVNSGAKNEGDKKQTLQCLLNEADFLLSDSSKLFWDHYLSQAKAMYQQYFYRRHAFPLHALENICKYQRRLSE